MSKSKIMNQEELDRYFRTVTRRERYYLENPGKPSPSYSDMQHKTIGGNDVLYFKLPALKEAEILIRRDSRFTDVPSFIHSNLNINYIYSGKCDYVINGLPVSLVQGDVALFDRDVVRRKLYAGEDDIVVNISMSNEFFGSSFLKQIGDQSIISSFMLHALSDHGFSHDHYMLFRTRNNALIAQLFRQLFIEYYSGRIYEKEMIQGLLHLIFIELLRVYREEPDRHMIQISSGQTHATIEILRYIEEHYTDCSLTGLSEVFGYHPKYLCSLLKKQTGKTFKEIQLEKRLSAAAVLLANTDEPVLSICQRIGISNQNYFYRQFEARWQMSPKAYREEKRSYFLPVD